MPFCFVCQLNLSWVWLKCHHLLEAPLVGEAPACLLPPHTCTYTPVAGVLVLCQTTTAGSQGNGFSTCLYLQETLG